MLSDLRVYNVPSDLFSLFVFLLPTLISKMLIATANSALPQSWVSLQSYPPLPFPLSHHSKTSAARFWLPYQRDYSACGFLPHAPCTHPTVELNSGIYSSSAICFTRSQPNALLLVLPFCRFSLEAKNFLYIHCDSFSPLLSTRSQLSYLLETENPSAQVSNTPSLLFYCILSFLIKKKEYFQPSPTPGLQY